MSKARLLYVILIIVLALGVSAAIVTADGSPAAEVAGVAPEPAGTGNATPSSFEWPSVVLYDNGPLVTHPGGGSGGADASALQTALLLSTYGFNHSTATAFVVADDFEVTDAGGWNVDGITFFAYQTGSTTTSTITDIVWDLYDGQPGAGGMVIASGSGISNTVWSNIYRTLDTDLAATNRPIMATTANVGGAYLPAGTYWIAWQATGTLASGPWAPPISILGQTTTGNALQFDGANWNPLNDTGAAAQQGLPFIIEGTVAAPAVPSIVMTKTVGLDPDTCATTDEITIPTPYGGNPVYYCYTVTNNGDVDLNIHDLFDSELGQILDGLNYALVAGASVDTVAAGLEISATITQTTVNTATWTACNPTPGELQACINGTDVVSYTASATVNVADPTSVSLSSFAESTSGSILPLLIVVAVVAGLGLALRRKMAA